MEPDHGSTNRAAPTPSRPARAWARYGQRVRRRDHSLRALVVHALFTSVITGLFVVGTAVVTGGMTPDGFSMILADPETADVEEPTPAEVQAAKRAAKQEDRVESIKALMAGNDCYTDDAPAPAVVPRFSVVTLPGEDPKLADSSVGFGIWLEGDPGEHHAFCP